MPDEKEFRQRSGPGTGTKEGEQLDKVLECLDSLSKRLDDIEAEEKKMQKMDDDDRRRRDKGPRHDFRTAGGDAHFRAGIDAE